MVRNHPGGFNVAFADGRVEFLTPEQLRSKLPTAVPEPPE
jgi:prepilin-type processing-associated H-X9-DG protein